MRIVALINESAVVERILRHLGLWYEQRQEQSVRARPGLDPPKILPADWIDLSHRSHDWTEWDGPFPDYEGEQIDMCAND